MVHFQHPQTFPTAHSRFAKFLKRSRHFGFALALAVVAAVALQAQAPAHKPAQPTSDPTQPLIKAADLQRDFAILRKAYETLHPGLYRYNTKAQMDDKFEKLRLRLNHDQSLKDVYLSLSAFAAQIQCGHTYPNFFNQPKSVVDQLFQGHNRVPFYFVWMNYEMVVTEDFTADHKLPRGTRVMQINGVPTSKILLRMLSIARADGTNDLKRIASVGVSGDSIYETFDIYFPLFFPQHDATLKLQILPPKAEHSFPIEVEALTYEQRIAPIKQREDAKNGGTDPQFEWNYLADGSAYLRMPNWALYDSKWDWKSWLNTHLDELVDKDAPGLVIDLRGNEGGLDVGNVILSRLVKSDLELNSMHRLVRYRKVPDELVPYLDTWDQSFKDWGKDAINLTQPIPSAPPAHYLELKRSNDTPNGDLIKVEGKHFNGKVLVLVDSNNSSATFQFAQTIKENHLGRLIGQPTGGNLRGINGGAFFFLRLPNSNIEMDLPLIGTFPETERPDSGLMPDFIVNPTIDDIAQDRDVVMAAVTGMLAF